jgi:hypothetical protein
MTLLEILDRKIDYTVVRDTPDRFTAKAQIGQRLINISIEPDELGAEPDAWNVVFWESDLKGQGFKVHATKSGNELEVFALVKEVMQDFVKKRNPAVLIFSAEKQSGSRAKLYNSFLTRFKLPNYKYERVVGDYDDHFYLRRQD